MSTLKDRILDFLYKQVSENKIPTIRKGMVEEFEGFVLNELASVEALKSSLRLDQRLQAAEQKVDDETNS